jgi:hypothetical protein
LYLAIFQPPEAAGDNDGKKTKSPPVSVWRSLRLIAIWVPLWFTPLIFLALVSGSKHLLVTQGIFLSILCRLLLQF